MPASRSILPLKECHVEGGLAHVIVAVLKVAVRHKRVVLFLCGTNPAAVSQAKLCSVLFFFFSFSF